MKFGSLASVLLFPLLISADSTNQCPLHAEHQKKHHEEIKHRGDQVMGFSHLDSTHHFYLFPDGGEIRVTVNSRENSEIIQKIRVHLLQVADLFSKGNFETPLQIHGKIPPGVDVMKARISEIEFKYRERSDGGSISIVSQNKLALEAIHDFLKFQIEDHQTGDTLQIQTDP